MKWKMFDIRSGQQRFRTSLQENCSDYDDENALCEIS